MRFGYLLLPDLDLVFFGGGVNGIGTLVDDCLGVQGGGTFERNFEGLSLLFLVWFGARVAEASKGVTT